jgi:endonuclease YncB( thermonuclease family)
VLSNILASYQREILQYLIMPHYSFTAALERGILSRSEYVRPGTQGTGLYMKKNSRCLIRHRGFDDRLICWRHGILVSIIVLCFILTGFIRAHAWTGQVVSVPEGDLLVISHDGKDQKFRLYGVDCPERGQPYWDKGQSLVSFLTKEQVVDVSALFLGIEGIEKALVRIEGTKDYLNRQLVAYGLAWGKPDECTSHMCSEGKELQNLARVKRLGLWADPRPIPPWEWKKVQWKVVIENKDSQTKSPESR